MNNELVLIKKEEINGVECDFYKKGDEFYMTRKQIGEALEYSEPMKAIAKIHERDKERMDKFSTIVKLTTVENGREVKREMVIYSEPGIYEILMKSDQPKAAEFRDKVYEVLKALRTKSHALIPTIELEKAKLAMHMRNADARYLKEVRANYEFLLSDKFSLSSESKQLIAAHFAEQTTGKPVLPRPQIERTYTASELAAELGMSPNALGRLANSNGLKTEEYGMFILDKARGHDKQVQSFIYKETGRQRLKELAQAIQH